MFKNGILVLILFLPTFVLANIKTYFNHNQSDSYTDPYRNIYRTGNNLEQVLLDQINSAKKTIFIAVQELRLPSIASALIQKKNQGVDVRIILENDYNFTVLSQRDISEDNEHESSRLAEFMALVDQNDNGEFEEFELESRDAIYMLRKAGVKITDDTSDVSKGSGLMHHKFMVVDGKTTVVSTANFTLSCIHGDILNEDSRGNANSMVVIQSSAVGDIFTEEFLQMWGNGRLGNFGLSKTYRGARRVNVKGTTLSIQFSPTSKKFSWTDSVNGLIGDTLSRAQYSVKGALFVFSEQKIANILEDLHNHGSSINFLIEPKFAYRYYSELLDMFGIEMRNPKCNYESDNRPWSSPLKDSGIARLSNGDVLHHKFAVIDDQLVIMGSQNWSEAANHQNDETLLVIENTNIASEYSQEFDRLYSSSLLGIPDWVTSQVRAINRDCSR